MSEQPNDIGKILKAEREKRALSLDIIHETTKIPMDSLRAIEEGYKIRTLSTFYYKSFVKIYAKYLGMDADKIIAMIPSTHSGTKAPVLDKLLSSAQRPAVPRQETRNLNLFARHTENRQGKKIA
ncbi:MAG: helix-turn-helix domain-containing protein, partial [Candidatus Omnitrophica bacterium]|nr:helix-turn-helix domain-containing protein [Candidatus Omnitrophota bacterium]